MEGNTHLPAFRPMSMIIMFLSLQLFITHFMRMIHLHMKTRIVMTTTSMMTMTVTLITNRPNANDNNVNDYNIYFLLGGGRGGSNGRASSSKSNGFHDQRFESRSEHKKHL